MVCSTGLPWGCTHVQLGEDLRQRRVVRRQVPEEMPAAGQPQATPVRANINADDLFAATLAILIHDWRGILAIPKRS